MSVQPVKQVKPASPIRLLYEELPKVYVFSAHEIFTTFCASFPNRIFRSVDKGVQGVLWFRTRILEKVARNVNNILGLSFLFFLLIILAPAGLALFCFSPTRRSISIVTTWNQQYNIFCDMMTNVFFILATENLLKYSFQEKIRAPQNTSSPRGQKHIIWVPITPTADNFLNVSLF